MSAQGFIKLDWGILLYGGTRISKCWARNYLWGYSSGWHSETIIFQSVQLKYKIVIFGISLSFCVSTKNSLNVVCYCSTFYKETILEQFQTVHIVWSFFSQWVYFCVEFHILQYPVNKDYFILYFKKSSSCCCGLAGSQGLHGSGEASSFVAVLIEEVGFYIL